jgi:predicted transcriptional regulator
MTSEEIKRLIGVAGFTQVDIAKALDVTPPLVSRTISGGGRSRTVEEFLFNLLYKYGLVNSFDEMWPVD